METMHALKLATMVLHRELVSQPCTYYSIEWFIFDLIELLINWRIVNFLLQRQCEQFWAPQPI